MSIKQIFFKIYCLNIIRDYFVGGASARLERGGFLCEVLLEENLLPSAQKMFLSGSSAGQKLGQVHQGVDGRAEEQHPEPAPDPEPHSEPLKCDQEEDGGS